MKTVFQNEFGTITEEHLTIQSGSVKVSIQINHIQSVDVVRKRAYLIAVLGFVFGIACLSITVYGIINGDFGIAIFTVFLAIFGFAVGLASFLGRHYILLEVENKTIKPIQVKMHKMSEAEHFYKALRRAAFGEKSELLSELK